MVVSALQHKRVEVLKDFSNETNTPLYVCPHTHTPTPRPHIHTPQDQTTYTHETVTNYYRCLESSFNMSFLNDTNSCSSIRDYVTLFNISCSNFTQTARHAVVTKRDGMNILGIIVFTVAFAIVLSRQPGGRRVVEAISVLNEAIMKLVSLVMW